MRSRPETCISLLNTRPAANMVQYIPLSMLMVLFCFVFYGYYLISVIHMINLPISFRVASLALGQSYDCPGASEATLEDMGKSTGTWPQHNTTKYKLYEYFMGCTEGNKSSWWHHRMETFSALLAICAGNSPATGEFPAQRPVTRTFDVFFDLHLNKRLSKQSWGWWFETPSWRHHDVNVMIWADILHVVILWKLSLTGHAKFCYLLSAPLQAV